MGKLYPPGGALKGISTCTDDCRSIRDRRRGRTYPRDACPVHCSLAFPDGTLMDCQPVSAMICSHGHRCQSRGRSKRAAEEAQRSPVVWAGRCMPALHSKLPLLNTARERSAPSKRQASSCLLFSCGSRSNCVKCECRMRVAKPAAAASRVGAPSPATPATPALTLRNRRRQSLETHQRRGGRVNISPGILQRLQARARVQTCEVD